MPKLFLSFFIFLGMFSCARVADEGLRRDDPIEIRIRAHDRAGNKINGAVAQALYPPSVFWIKSTQQNGYIVLKVFRQKNEPFMNIMLIDQSGRVLKIDRLDIGDGKKTYDLDMKADSEPPKAQS